MNISINLPKLYNHQEEIKADVSRNKVLNAGRRWGKNLLMHDTAVNGVLRGEVIGWGSPTYKNLLDDWRTLSDILQPIVKRTSEKDYRIETITGGILEMWTLDNPTPIKGRAYDLFILNEAALVKYLMSTWNEIIRPTLIDRHGKSLFGSTPLGVNDFHTIYNYGKNIAGWKSWHFTSYDNPYLDKEELDSLKDTMSDRQFRQEIMAEFLLSDAAVFRNLDAALMAPYEEAKEHEGHTIVAGVDWGKVNDFSVLSIGCCNCRREVALDRFNQIDYHFQRQRLEAMSHKWKVRRWEVELNAIGIPNFEELQRAKLPVVAFSTTNVSKAPLIEGMSLALEKGDLQLLPDDTGRSELQSYEVHQTDTGLSKYGCPDGMHDDTVIARALMWRAMQNTRIDDNPQKQKKDKNELEKMRKAYKL